MGIIVVSFLNTFKIMSPPARVGTHIVFPLVSVCVSVCMIAVEMNSFSLVLFHIFYLPVILANFNILYQTKQGTVAHFGACPHGIQATPSWTPTSVTFSIFLFHYFKKSSCQLMVKECALDTGYLQL